MRDYTFREDLSSLRSKKNRQKIYCSDLGYLIVRILRTLFLELDQKSYFELKLYTKKTITMSELEHPKFPASYCFVLPLPLFLIILCSRD